MSRATWAGGVSLAIWTAGSAAAGAVADTAAYVEGPFQFASTPGRLPKNVVPEAYQVSITPDAAKLTIAGHERIALKVTAATTSIVFNSLHETLSDVKFDGKPVAKTVSDDEQQLTTVTLAHPAAPGAHVLTFDYAGHIEQQAQGLFAQPYRGVDGQQGVLLSTQFESTDARRMFPCWDEPAFRATFQLSATVASDLAVVSNMPIEHQQTANGMTTTTFGITPRMPTYLVEFSAGHLGAIEAQAGKTHFRVLAIKGREGEGKQALANAQQILADYNEYFGIPYPLPKLDSIAVPGGFAGAMENWGAITYNDQALLLGASATVGDAQEVYSIQAHEMAHQWFGDLVTMAWWDDLWLNESFASWRAAKETDLRNPSWKWWEVQDADKEGAMAADSRASSHSIQQHVSDELQANNAFDPQITYSKGQAILRMFESYLGEDRFREGIRRHMKAHAYSNATTADLWNSLGQVDGRPFSQIAAGWVEQAGFPVVRVATRCDAGGSRTLTLSQQRFLMGGEASTLRWQIPLRLRSGNGADVRSVLLRTDGQGIAAGHCGEALSLNAGAVGFYRVHYDAKSLADNVKAFGAMPDGDRIALLDDEWALVLTGEEPLANYLALASHMGEDLDARAWAQIVEALSRIEYAERGNAGHDAFARYARGIVGPVAARLGWSTRPGETPNVIKLRALALTSLGAWDDPQVIAQARERFARFVADRHSLSADEQAPVLDVVGMHADAATFEQLHALAKSAQDQSELTRWYHALVLVRDPALAEQAAKIALSDEIPPQAAMVRIGLIANLSQWHHQLSWNSFTTNSKQLLSAYPTFAPLILAQYTPELFWDSAPFEQMESWLKSQIPAEMAPNLARGMEAAHLRVEQKARLAKAAEAFLAGGGAAGV